LNTAAGQPHGPEWSLCCVEIERSRFRRWNRDINMRVHRERRRVGRAPLRGQRTPLRPPRGPATGSHCDWYI